MSVSESQLQQQVADYLRLQYPDVLFHSDFGSGVKLTPFQATMQKRQNGGRRAWPDMFIAHPYVIKSCDADDTMLPFEGGYYIPSSELGEEQIVYLGIFLELKKEGTRLKKKNGEWASEHIAEQAKVLEDLQMRGYCAEFAVGFDEAKKIIDEYQGGKK